VRPTEDHLNGSFFHERRQGCRGGTGLAVYRSNHEVSRRPPVKSGFEQRDRLESAEALRLEDAELTPAFALRRARQLCRSRASDAYTVSIKIRVAKIAPVIAKG
jgi:hypothetical protein